MKKLEPETFHFGENGEEFKELHSGTVILNRKHEKITFGETEDGLFIWQGDIELPKIGNQLKGNVRLGARWPKGSIPYTLSPTLSNRLRANIREAIEYYHTNTSIRFYQKTRSDTDYVLFKAAASSSISSASVGCIGGRQYIRLGTSTGVGSAIHEMGHTIGLFHEQCRPDRNRYVKINSKNIRAGFEHNFRIHGSERGPYDFKSRMHYTSHAFSRNGRPTISPINSANRIKPSSRLTQGDINAINSLYGFSCGTEQEQTETC